jgi:hypothetical protein
MLSGDAPSATLRAAAIAFAVDAQSQNPAAWALLCDALERAAARVAAATASGDGAAVAAAAAAARALLAAAGGNALAAQGVPPSIQWPRIVTGAGITSGGTAAGGVILRTAAFGAASVGPGVRTGTHYFEVCFPSGSTHGRGCHLVVGFAPAAVAGRADAGVTAGFRTRNMLWVGSNMFGRATSLPGTFRPGATLGVAVDFSSGAVACHYDGAWRHDAESVEFGEMHQPEEPQFATVEFVPDVAGADVTPAFPPLTLRRGVPLPPGAPSRVKPDKWVPPGAAAAVAPLDAHTATRLRGAAGALLDVLAGVPSSGEEGPDEAEGEASCLMVALANAEARTRDGATALLTEALAAGADGAPLPPSRAAMRTAVLDSAAKSPADALRHAGDGTLSALCAAAERDFRALLAAAVKHDGGDATVEAALPPAQSPPSPTAEPAATAAAAASDDPLASLSAGDAANVRALMELLGSRDAWEVYMELRAHNNDVQATANTWLEAQAGHVRLRGPEYAREHGIPLSPPQRFGNALPASAPAQAPAPWTAGVEASDGAAAATAHVDVGALRVLAQLQLGVYARAHGGEGDGAEDAPTSADKDAAAELTVAVLRLCGDAAEHAAAAMGAAAAGRSRRAWFRRASPIDALLPAAAAFLSTRAAVVGAEWARRLASALTAAPPALRACAALEPPGEPARNCPLHLAWSAIVTLSLDDGARTPLAAATAAAAAMPAATAPAAPPSSRLRTQLSAALADWFAADELSDLLTRSFGKKSADATDASAVPDASGAGNAPARSRLLPRSHSVRLGPSSSASSSASMSPAGSLAPAASVRAAEPASALAPLLTDGVAGEALWALCAPFWTPRADAESSSQEGAAAACEAAVARAMLAALLHHGGLTDATASAAAARRAAHGGLSQHALHALLPARVEQCAARAATAALELVEAHVHSEEGVAMAAERAAGLVAAVRERAALLLTLPPTALRAAEAADAASSATTNRLRIPLLSPASSAATAGGGLRAAQSVGGGGLRAAQSVGAEASGGGGGLRPAQSVGLPQRRTLSRSSSMQPRASNDEPAANGEDEEDVGARRRTMFRLRAALAGSFRAGADPAARRDDRVVRFLSLAPPQRRDAEAAAAVAPDVTPEAAPEQACGLVATLRQAVALITAVDAPAARTVVLTAQLCLGAAQPSPRPAADAADADAVAKELAALSMPLTRDSSFAATSAPSTSWLLPYLLAPRIADAALFLVHFVAPDALVDKLLDNKHVAMGATAFSTARDVAAVQLALHADAAFGGAAGGSDAAATARATLLRALLRGIAACRDALLQTPCPLNIANAQASTASVLLGVLSSCRPMCDDADARALVAALWALTTCKFAAAAPAVAHAALHQLQALLPHVSPATADAALAGADGAGEAADDTAGSVTVDALAAMAAQAEQALAHAKQAAAAAPPAHVPAADAATAQAGTATAGMFGAPLAGGFGAAQAASALPFGVSTLGAPSASVGFGAALAVASPSPPSGFGAPAAFGAPAGGFGAATASLSGFSGGGMFGAPASSGFGAQAAPMFGSPPAFGAPVSGFGAATAPPSGFGGGGAFGAPASSGVSAQAAPMFGVPGGGLGFAPTSSAFGAGTPVTAPSPFSGFAQPSFGAANPFGAAVPLLTSASPFGRASATAPPAGASPFAGVAATSTPAVAFGAPAAASITCFGAVAPAAAPLSSTAAFGVPATAAAPKPTRVAGVASLGAAAAALLQRLAQCDAWRPAVAAFLARALADWRAAPPCACVALGLLGGVGETLRAGAVCTSEKTGSRYVVLQPPELEGPSGFARSLLLRLDAAGAPTAFVAPDVDAQPVDLAPAAGASDEECDAALTALLPMLTCTLTALLEDGAGDACADGADMTSPRLDATAMRALAQLCATSPARSQAALAGAGQLARVLRAGAAAPARLHHDARVCDAVRELEEVYAACAQAELRGDANSEADSVPHAGSFWAPMRNGGAVNTPLLCKLGAGFAAAAPNGGANTPNVPFWLKPSAEPVTAAAAHVANASAHDVMPPRPAMAAENDAGAWATAPATDAHSSLFGGAFRAVAAGEATGSQFTNHPQQRRDMFRQVSSLGAERRHYIAAAACRALAACHCLQAALALLSTATPGSLAGASGAEVLAVITAGASSHTSVQQQRTALAGALVGIAPSMAAALVRDALTAVASSSTAARLSQDSRTGLRVLATAIAATETGRAPPGWACGAVNTPAAAHALLCVAHGSTGVARRRALRLLARLLRARKALLLLEDAPSANKELVPDMAAIHAAFEAAFSGAQISALREYGTAAMHALADVLMASEELAAALPPPPPPAPDAAQTDVATWSRRAKRVLPLGGDAFSGTFELAPLDAHSEAPHAWSLLQAGATLGGTARFFEVRVQERAAAGVAVGVAVQQARAQDVCAPTVAALADGLVRGASVPEPFAVFWASDGQLHSAAAIIKVIGRDLNSKFPVSDVWLPRYGVGDRVGIGLAPPVVAGGKSTVDLVFVLNGTTVARHTFARTAESFTGKVWAVRARWLLHACLHRAKL